MTTPAATRFESAGIGRRILGLLIDWVASILVALVVFPMFPYGSTESSLAVLGVFAVETIFFTWLIGASFGNTAVGIRIVRVDGGRLQLWRAFVRTLLLCLVIPAIVMDGSGRGLHDKAVGSRAVLRRSMVSG